MGIALEIIDVGLYILAVLSKKKWQMMGFLSIANIASTFMYFYFGRVAAACISIVAFARTVVFMIYSYKNLKPNFVWLIVFEVAFLVSTILTWQDALDLLPLIAILIVCYGSWQENQTVLRSSYIVDKILFATFQLIIGAYISMTVNFASAIVTFITLVYYCIYKKEISILQLIFGRKKKEQSAPTQELVGEEVLQQSEENVAEEGKA